MAILTDTKARNLKPDDKPLPHGGVTGLALHPSPTKGRGKWVLRYVSPVTQKRRNAGLGSYPEISIADAAKSPKKVEGDAGSMEQHSLPDQIAADRYLASKNALKSKGRGFRVTKMIPPGAG